MKLKSSVNHQKHVDYVCIYILHYIIIHMYIFQINYIPTCFTVYFLDHFQTLAATFSAANLAGEHFGGRVRDDA